MTNSIQDSRQISLTTPLGEDELILRGFTVHEEVSHLFEIHLDLYSENYEIEFNDIVGQNVTIRVLLKNGGTRYWNGYISQFGQEASESVQYAQYRAIMVPWLWMLTRTTDCRIFQNQTVPDIIQTIFEDLGFSDIDNRLSGEYREWTYCVQYRETDFDFVSRLMEHEGIYYYFVHEENKCNLVLADDISAHETFGEYDEISFSATRQSSLAEKINDWKVTAGIMSGRFAHTDYFEETPSTLLMSTAENVMEHAEAEYEVYDYPGNHTVPDDGNRYATMRMEALAQPHEICSGKTDARGISTGHKFNLTMHPQDRQNREYFILSVDYELTAHDYETSGGTEDLCKCSFTAMPAEVPYRPQQITPKPTIRGTQTAIVTGPAGEEIYTDALGRIKVQFHWDREGQFDENSSCWIRVSQVHAGKGFGGIDIPRIGEEVIVSFLEGDPDRPLITGRVYNAELMPPFGLPGQKVLSGMKSNSTPGGGGYNEFTLNDTKGNEGVTLHAQKDMNTTIENDENHTLVGGNRTVSVQAGTQSVTVQGDTSLSVVGGNRTVAVQAGTQSVTVKGDTSLTVEAGNRTVNVTGNYQLDATSEVNVQAPSKIKLTCGGSAITIEPAKITISAGGGSSVTLDANALMKSPSEAKIDAPTSILSGGGSTTKADGSGVNISTGGIITETASLIKHNA
ncbi:MAG: type VI secretion system tip protein VgrG [Deltaproteobacteria bacterium]|nr:MAG: type VI secretion system tip protein VgrG [Deltaproteobacteria bacterium]